MRTTQQMSITLPIDMADVVKAKVRTGEYAVGPEAQEQLAELYRYIAEASPRGCGASLTAAHDARMSIMFISSLLRH